VRLIYGSPATALQPGAIGLKRACTAVVAASAAPAQRSEAMVDDEETTDNFKSNAASIATGRFNVAEIAATFPATAETMLVDQYLTDRPGASARIFRIYKPIPPHFHRECDEYL